MICWTKFRIIDDNLLHSILSVYYLIRRETMVELKRDEEEEEEEKGV